MREKVEMTSEKIPKAGRITIYTSGWPQSQNRLAQSISMPPADTVKKWVPYSRSKVIKASATVRIGNAATIITLVISEVQVNIGIRISFMLGVRIFRMVTIKLTPVIRVPIPDIWSATA
ncbi:hypothetical protein D3C76_1205310 [compost metagenome]